MVRFVNQLNQFMYGPLLSKSILGRYDDDCNEYYCCHEGRCLIGTYELLKRPYNPNYLTVIGTPYHDPDYDYYDRQVDCNKFRPGEGTPLKTEGSK